MNFAQINVSLVADGITALTIIRGKMMEFHEIWERDLRKKRFWRLVDAWYAANHYGMWRTAQQFAQALTSMGGSLDGYGHWHDETGAETDMDDAPGADLSAGWEY